MLKIKTKNSFFILRPPKGKGMIPPINCLFQLIFQVALMLHGKLKH